MIARDIGDELRQKSIRVCAEREDECSGLTLSGEDVAWLTRETSLRDTELREAVRLDPSAWLRRCEASSREVVDVLAALQEAGEEPDDGLLGLLLEQRISHDDVLRALGLKVTLSLGFKLKAVASSGFEDATISYLQGVHDLLGGKFALLPFYGAQCVDLPALEGSYEIAKAADGLIPAVSSVQKQPDGTVRVYKHRKRTSS